MFYISAAASHSAAWRGLLVWAVSTASLWTLGMAGSAVAKPASVRRDLSGWRGGIGIAFGTPSRAIADVSELGYDIVWGSDDPRASEDSASLSSVTGTTSSRPH